MSNKKAVVLLSGGLDSAVTAAIARQKGFDIYALSFDYGQRHRREIAQSRKLAKHLGAKKHLILEVDLRQIGGSALTDRIAVPKRKIINKKDIPITYVPARNTIFLALALGWAEVLGARDIFIGANAIDYSGYPDCRPQFIRAFDRLANLATKAGIGGRRFRIQAPLIKMTKSQIIRKGYRLGIDLLLTHSCYDPAKDGRACGVCDSCQIRLKGFKQAGLEDPISYSQK